MKKFTYLLLSTWLLVAHVAMAGDLPQLKETHDLYTLGEKANKKDLPILVMFSQTGCAYCVVLEDQYLRPMLKSGDYRDKVIIRKVKIDGFDTLRNFDGSEIEASDFAGKYRAYVTPTMVFLDHNGNELTSRLMGVGTEGFFAAEIDQAIDTSLNRLRSVALK
ncbi:MAG: thioredoxin fold domain-containing protein [Gammaproteobacteria bacterium]|jgi:thioredoxin-related protein